MPHRPRLILLLAALACVAQDEPAILAPPKGATFARGPVRFIARIENGAQPRLDGKALTGESPVPGMVTAELVVGPGAHEIVLGKETVRFFVGAGASAEFKPFRFHPPMANCNTCHAVKNGEWAFQKPSLVTLCSQCHDRDKFAAKHTHVIGVLADCQICHDPHGSTEVGHLKKSKEVACKQCHS